ncbi:MAG: HAE1 family hydrophobic/amphiphilic exporter-1 [Gammaproteobacteria bacterium]|jgi:HAE1 family hydrophobic/amphiphilic exporter-1
MNLIRLSIERPIAVFAAILMVVMFGLVAFRTIPIQLIPDVARPIITVTTNWYGAAPAEIERELVNRQEEVFKGLEGLEQISSAAEHGRAQITLEFLVSTNMDKALLLVSNRLDRVSGYPDEADEPELKTSGSEDNSIAWMILTRATGNERPVHTFGDFAEDEIRDRLERVPGVGRIDVYGGSEREMQVVVDPAKLARFGLTVTAVVRELRSANASVTAGDVDEGKRRYIVRTQGELETIPDLRNVVLRSERDASTGQVARVTVGDVATVDFAYKTPRARIRHLSNPSIAFGVKREIGANVIVTMQGLRDAVSELSEGVIKRNKLILRQVYDETVYINSAISLVRQNIYVGGVLAALILLLFLRSLRATTVVVLAIPVSVIGSFVAMAVLGRSINVISLAGLAFAVGMVVDAAIVVLENIYRLRQQGASAAEAAYEGTRQVWGAVFVSALTTVMVFIPILVLDLEVGQLFRDIAVAISVAVILSLIVAVTVIPALASFLLDGRISSPKSLKIPIVDDAAALFVRLTTGFARMAGRSHLVSLLIVGTICAGASFVTWHYLPKLEYLPEGNRNLVFGVIIPPPGYNLDTTTDIAKGVEGAVRKHWVGEARGEPKPDDPPRMDNFFFVATPARTFVGATSAEPERASEMIPVLSRPVFREPGTFGFMSQPSLFGRTIGGGRRVDLNIFGSDLEVILSVARQAMGLVGKVLPREAGHQTRPRPGLELGAPEVRLVPNRMRLADSGVSVRELGDTVDAFNDGLRVAEITVGGKRLDLMLSGPQAGVKQTQGIGALPVVTRAGMILPVRSLADVEVTSGPTEIRHLERQRTVTIEIRPAPGMALEEAMTKITEQVIAPLRRGGLPPGIRLGLSGTANKLQQTWDAMVWQLLMALVIVYLVLAILFESFAYPVVIVLSVPLATAGAVGGLVLLNQFQFQPLDMLTLLGFVILIGIVVNNAILLVHQALFHLREEGLPASEAIVEATRNRIRPIFMSTLTSVVGMLPLVLFPGAGSELYRGLGSVVVGGLALSAILTLAIIPPLLSLTFALLERGPSPKRSKAALASNETAKGSP